MAQLLFFASLREALGVSSLDLPIEPGWTAQSVREALIDSHPEWREHLMQEQLLLAVNQEIADWQLALTEGDEIAFYPPVTGG